MKFDFECCTKPEGMGVFVEEWLSGRAQNLCGTPQAVALEGVGETRREGGVP